MPDSAAGFEARLRVVPSWAERKCIFRHRQHRGEEVVQFLVVEELETRLEEVSRRLPSFQIVASDLAMTSNFFDKCWKVVVLQQSRFKELYEYPRVSMYVGRRP